MNELPLWTDELGRMLLDANPWAAAVGPERTGCGCVFAWSKIPKEESDCWGNGKRECLGFFRLPPGRKWQTLLVTRGSEKPPEPEPIEIPEWAMAMVNCLKMDTTSEWLSKYGPRLDLAECTANDLAGLLIEECERLREYRDRREKEDAAERAEIDRIVKNLTSMPGPPSKSKAVLDKLRTLLGMESGPVGDVIVAAAAEVERLRAKQQELFDWVNDLAARCNGLTHSHKRLVEIADAARAQLADLPRNADGDVVLPPWKGWVVHRKTGEFANVGAFRVDSISRQDGQIWWAMQRGRSDMVKVSDFYSTEESARRAAEVKP